MNKVAEVVIRGMAVEDVVAIMARNGYATEVFTPCIPLKSSWDEAEHVVRVYKPKKEGE